jgi:DnaK suppressor protein
MGKRLSGATLSSSERAAMQDLLNADRESTMIQIAALTRDWDGIVESSTLVANDDEHDPEGATLAFERAQLESLLDRARSRLEDLDQMAERLRDGTYGVCESCGQPIAFERLKARPVARTCIECAARRR